MNDLKLGVIGSSEGNGHPYSWSAICNGYNSGLMAECPYPVIPDYLAKESFPSAQISAAQVTHIWTQCIDESHKISRATNIPLVVNHYTDMIGEVDAILLARDDAENHYAIAKPFIEAGLPIFIDKPLAYSVAEAEEIFELEKYKGQIFTCSSLKYAKEFNSSKAASIGEIYAINAKVIKSWAKYSIHVIDPILNFIAGDIDKSIVTTNEFSTRGTFLTNKNEHINIITSHTNDFPIEIELFGTKGYRKLIFQDTFFAFKASINCFLDSIRSKVPARTKSDILNSILWIELGMKECYA